MSIEALSWAWRQTGLKPIEKLVLLAIADHADDLGRNIFPSRSRLAKKTGLGETTVGRVIKSLSGKHKKMEIEKVRSKAGDFDHNEYNLLISKDLSVLEGVGPKRPANHPNNHPKEKEGTSGAVSATTVDDPQIKALPTDPPAPNPKTPEWPSVELLVKLYNEEAADELPAVTRLSPARRKKAHKYLKEFPDEAFWREVFAETKHSKFLRGLRSGVGHEGFKGDFDWLLTKGKDQTENCVKVFEGRYRD